MQNGKLFVLNAQNYIHLWKNSNYEINMELKLNDVNLDIPQSLCLHSSYFFTQTIALPYYAKLKKIRLVRWLEGSLFWKYTFTYAH